MECGRISLAARVEISDKHCEHRNIQLTLMGGYSQEHWAVQFTWISRDALKKLKNIQFNLECFRIFVWKYLSVLHNILTIDKRKKNILKLFICLSLLKKIYFALKIDLWWLPVGFEIRTNYHILIFFSSEPHPPIFFQQCDCLTDQKLHRLILLRLTHGDLADRIWPHPPSHF